MAEDLIQAQRVEDLVIEDAQPQVYRHNAIDPKVIQILDTYNEYRFCSPRQDWETHVREDEQFRNNVQWDSDEIDDLEAKGQSPVTINRIHPAIDTAVSILTQNNPQFRCLAKEDADVKDAKLRNDIFEYILTTVNDFQRKNKKFVNDYYEKSVGIFQVYQDFIEGGDGEIKIMSLYPLDVVPDPNSRDPMWDDAERIFIQKVLTVKRLNYMYPQEKFREIIKSAEMWTGFDYPATDKEPKEGQVFPGDYASGGQDTEYRRVIEQYEKVKVPAYTAYETWTNTERKLDEDQYEEYMGRVAAVVTSQKGERRLFSDQALTQIIGMIKEFGPDIAMIPQFGPVRYVPGMQLPEGAEVFHIEMVRYIDLVETGELKIQTFYQTKIAVTCIVGSSILYEYLMPISHYPIIVCPNRHTDTPFPLSDVRMWKGLQDYVNVMSRLNIAHATTSAGMKLIVPDGSVDDIDKLEQDWGRPTAVISVDMSEGEPHLAQPSPMAAETVMIPERAKQDIEYGFGIFPLMMGDSGSAHKTVGGTIAIEEYGQRRLKGKLQDLEASYRRMGQVMLDLIPHTYTSHRIFRIVQPDKVEKTLEINVQIYDRYSGQLLKRINDVTDKSSKFDVVVVSGSTMPTNRWAQANYYMEAYKMGLIDRISALKKMDIVDVEEVIKRFSEIAMMQRALQEKDEALKKVKGDNQTLEREIRHARERSELYRYKDELRDQGKDSEVAVKTATGVFTARMKDKEREFADRLNQEIEAVKPSG